MGPEESNGKVVQRVLVHLVTFKGFEAEHWLHARGNYDVNKVGPIHPISSDEWVRFGYIVAMPGWVGFVLWAPFRALVKQFIFIPFCFG